jgi:predicted ribosomally synthesized peptide with nif11-like leader
MTITADSHTRWETNLSAEAATALYERVNSDEEFRARLEAADTPDDKRRIVTEAGYDVSRDDLSTIRRLAGVSELSDEDLEKVAGGGNTTVVVTISAAGVSASVAALV